MVTSKFKMYAWLIMTFVSIGLVVERGISFAKGETEWWELLTSVVIVMVCSKFFLENRKAQSINKTGEK